MLKLNTTRRLPAAAAFLTCSLLIYAADTKPSAAPSKPAPTDAELITSATAAAPAKVSAHATIVTMNADGTMHIVRKGTNGFTCMADNPATPGPDPMCLDQSSVDWVHALMSHKRISSGKFLYWPSARMDVRSRWLLAHEFNMLIWGGDPKAAQAAPMWRPLNAAPAETRPS